MKINFKSLILLILIIVIVVSALSYYSEVNQSGDKFTHGKLIELFEKDLVRTLVIDENSLVTVGVLQPVGTNANGDRIFKQKENGEFDLLQFQ